MYGAQHIDSALRRPGSWFAHVSFVLSVKLPKPRDPAHPHSPRNYGEKQYRRHRHTHTHTHAHTHTHTDREPKTLDKAINAARTHTHTAQSICKTNKNGAHRAQNVCKNPKTKGAHTEPKHWKTMIFNTSLGVTPPPPPQKKKKKDNHGFYGYMSFFQCFRRLKHGNIGKKTKKHRYNDFETISRRERHHPRDSLCRSLKIMLFFRNVGFSNAFRF